MVVCINQPEDDQRGRNMSRKIVEL